MGSLGGAGVRQAIGKLEADTVRVRSEGLEELRRIFGRGHVGTDDIGDKIFYQILETLFSIVRTERQTYLRAIKTTSKKTASSKLSAASSVVRLVTEYAGSKLEQKTVSALLDHIIDALPATETIFCTPIEIDYLRCFHTILQYRPYAEHLRTKQWFIYVDFLLDAINSSLAEDADDSISSRSRQAHESFRTGQSVAIRGSQISNSHLAPRSTSTNVPDPLRILCQLTSITNAPLRSRLTQLSETLTACISSVSQSIEAAFESLNNILPVTLTEDVSLAVSIFKDICGPIQRLWNTKSIDLRDQMIISLFYLRHIYLQPLSINLGADASLLDLIVGVIWSECEKGSERELLQLDALSFIPSAEPSVVSLHDISPANDSDRITMSWSTLYVLSLLLVGLHNARKLSDELSSMQQSSKRRRLEHSYEDIFWRIQSGTGSVRIVAIQLAIFVSDHLHELPSPLVDSITKLDLMLGEDDLLTTSWTMLLLARYTQFDSLSVPSFHSFWRKVWTAAARAITNSSCSRYACYLLYRIVLSGLARSLMSAQDISNSIFSDGSSGPAVLADTALLLLTTTLTRALSDNERASKHFASRSLNWLDARWVIPTVPDLLHNSQTAAYGEPYLLSSLLCAIVGTDLTLQYPHPEVFRGSFYHAVAIDNRDLALTKFKMTGIDGLQPVKSVTTIVREAGHSLSAQAYLTMDAIAEFLTLKIRSFRSAWLSLTTERIANVNTEVAEVAATACSVSTLILFWGKSYEQSLESNTVELWTTICDSCSRHSQEVFEKMAVRVAARLLQVRSSDVLTWRQLARARKQLVLLLMKRMKQGPESQDVAMWDFELADSFDANPSQASQTRSLRSIVDENRYDLPQYLDPHTHFIVSILYLSLDSLVADSSGIIDADIMSKFIAELVSVHDNSLFSVRSVIQYVLDLDISVKRADVSILVEKIGYVCLQQTNLERCEAALCLSLRVVTEFTRQWAGSEEDNLANVAFDIYEWYLNKALGKSIASERVLQHLSTLLEAVLRVNPSYAHGELPSPRTILLQILHKSSAGLKFQLAPQLSTLFEGYVLSEHTAIFDDIVENLPSDPDDEGGIEARLYILAYLGARWHTVLREAVYHIFDTAANVPTVSGFAKKCVYMVCDFLHITDVRALFRLFSSQIFYTWLEKNEKLDIIPAKAFGYDSIRNLLLDNQDEIVAQIVMRASSSHADEITALLSCSWKDLIITSFARAIAYAIIVDLSSNRSSRGVGQSEKFMLDALDDNTYSDLLLQHLAEALSIIVLRLSDDRGFEKAVDSGSSTNSITANFEAMCQFSSSKTQLPPGQQPSFRVKYLVPMLKKLSSRVGFELEQLWTPPLLTFVLRSLLDDTDQALGPLHACATMRKLRVLLSISGPVARQDYNLEMLLHSVRPYMTVFHCSADALGIIWFLLEHGKPCLQLRLPFVAGLGVTMFASLSRFVNSTQDSTTQESHFRTTISHAENFRTWLGQYLTAFDTTILSAHSSTVFTDVIESAAQLTQDGSNSRSSSEGSLLYHLLMDQVAEKPLLTKAFFHYILEGLSRNFSIATDPMDDILAADGDIAKVTPVLWMILDEGRTGDTFRQWIGGLLGRAYLISGPEAVTSMSRSSGSIAQSKRLHLRSLDSYAHIVSALIDHLWGSNREFASAAEQSLQLMFSSFRTQDKSGYLNTSESEQLYPQLRFDEFTCPNLLENRLKEAFATPTNDGMKDGWATDLAIYLCRQFPYDPILTHLSNIMIVIPSLSSTVLPSIVHISLLAATTDQVNIGEYVAGKFSDVMSSDDTSMRGPASLALKIIVYLRRCIMQPETTMGQRNTWLSINYEAAAFAAFRYGEYHTALLMLEIHASQHALKVGRTTKRASAGESVIPRHLLTSIYRNLDDPDFFYGTTQDSDFASIVGKLCHEGDGKKALSFQSALFDANVRIAGLDDASKASSNATMTALNMANFRALASIVGRASSTGPNTTRLDTSVRSSSLNLEQWSFGKTDILTPEDTAMTSVFNVLGSAAHLEPMLSATDSAIQVLTGSLSVQSNRPSINMDLCSSLAILTEIRQTLSLQDFEGLPDTLAQRLDNKLWIERARFGSIEKLLLARELFALMIKNNASLRTGLKMTDHSALLMEIKILRSSLFIGRAHDMFQFSLNRAAYMSDLIQSASSISLKVDVAIQYDTANTFWSQDENAASIEILQTLQSRNDLNDQSIHISKSEILTDLGQKLTQARLDRADEITSQYLRPAIESLEENVDGSKAGKVYHNFAVFCDQQLRDPDNLDEYYRVERLRNRKKQEVEELEALKRGKEGKERDQLRSHLAKAQTWFKLDEQEWRRLKKHREGLISNCLENYLRSMRSCDDFPNDVLRFLALWLEQSQNSDANVTVGEYVRLVQSYKFAPLMNQLSSRILDEQDAFQKILFHLMFRICNDHPYHSLYQIFATSKSKGQKNDTVATSRHRASTKLSENVMKKGSANSTWIAIHNTCIAFVRVAQERATDRDLKAGSKIQLRKFSTGAKLEQAVQDSHRKIPPPTMKIALRPNCDYSSVPTLTSFEPYITIAGGISAPKIVTAVASNGTLHKMLLKGGNDDLRQDSIMEQVFEQVSNLLQDHRITRQRNLGIRTYKVIPLMHNAGIIEFVQNTIPLHDFVLPAHGRYYPRDYKPSRCRKEISDVQTKPVNQRLQAYRNVTSNFHPVMRFFFMEHFLDPDDWFQKRLNYSRSTAAISILGYVLGLGDRHGHNILLDAETGEVVHIDLGVAFEAGRVLPVPEVVPFRLTRDIVDGMGISGVEGVFRRCCNFTLEALRQDQEAIMTILDVLRWDPLYSWSISPIRLQRMQENQEQTANAITPPTSTATSSIAGSDGNNVNPKAEPGQGPPVPGKQNNVNEPGEADRALAVVARKLGKGLSVEATVNDLIRQAMDERNLAVLYCGWAAYA